MLATMLISAFQDMDRVLQADLPLLGRSPRAGASPVGSTCNLTCFPCWIEVLERFPCWVEVLEQVSPAGVRWNLIWKPVSVHVARPELPLLDSKSSSRCLSCWVNMEPNLEPGKCPPGFGAGASPVGSKSSSKCLPPARSTWNLTLGTR